MHLFILSQYFFVLSHSIFWSNDELVYFILSPASRKNCCIHVIYVQPYIHFIRVHLAIWLSPNHNIVNLFSCQLLWIFSLGSINVQKNIFPKLTAYGISPFFMFANISQFWDTNSVWISYRPALECVKTSLSLSLFVPYGTAF